MDILDSPSAMQAWRRANPGPLGMVPTMGYLHEGHLALVRRALVENELVTVSIFVNPTQFAAHEDLDKYPRDEARDLAMLREAGVAAVYLPTPAAMYPEGYQTYVAVEEVTRPLEGASRPTHFRGVTTVVTKLFNAVMPDRAYFGRKDAQQLRVIQRMAIDLDSPVEIVPCDTVREPDGLAMSSRNVYLTSEQRAAAPVIRRALTAARDSFQDGVRDARVLRDGVHAAIAAESFAEIDYVSLADSITLDELHGQVEREALLSVAVRFGPTRLIDNIELG